MNPSTKRDLEQLERMKASYEDLMMKWRNPTLEHHERQILTVSLMMLREYMVEKTRDVRRRLRGTSQYL